MYKLVFCHICMHCHWCGVVTNLKFPLVNERAFCWGRHLVGRMIKNWMMGYMSLFLFLCIEFLIHFLFFTSITSCQPYSYVDCFLSSRCSVQLLDWPCEN